MTRMAYLQRSYPYLRALRDTDHQQLIDMRGAVLFHFVVSPVLWSSI